MVQKLNSGFRVRFGTVTAKRNDKYNIINQCQKRKLYYTHFEAKVAVASQELKLKKEKSEKPKFCKIIPLNCNLHSWVYIG